jgi:hypothetical protein
MMGTNGSVRPQTLAPDNAALDVLAVKFIVLREDELVTPATFEREGIPWTRERLNWGIGRTECGHPYARTSSIALPADIAVRSIRLAAMLGCSLEVPQGREVARLRLVGPDGVHEQVLQAGVHVADRLLTDPHVTSAHRATAFFVEPDERRHGYVTRIDLPQAVRATRLEIEGAPTGGWMIVDRVTVADMNGSLVPLAAPAAFVGDARRWHEVKRFRTSRTSDRGVDEAAPGEVLNVVYENQRARPRAWIVSQVHRLPEAELAPSVHYGQLPDGTPFDAATMAVVPADGPETPGIRPGKADAHVVEVEDARITVAVTSEAGGFLELSEAYYPGWRARIGDRTLTVLRANVALQGVEVPPGTHRVEFEFEPLSQRAGVALSLIAVAAVVFIASRRLRASG